MCGIVGYVGQRPACAVVVEALRRMEYRGYDSSGVALLDGNGGLTVRRRAGRLANLETALAEAEGGASRRGGSTPRPPPARGGAAPGPAAGGGGAPTPGGPPPGGGGPPRGGAAPPRRPRAGRRGCLP